MLLTSFLLTQLPNVLEILIPSVLSVTVNTSYLYLPTFSYQPDFSVSRNVMLHKKLSFKEDEVQGKCKGSRVLCLSLVSGN